MTHLLMHLGLTTNVLWTYLGILLLHVAVTAAPAVIGIFRPGLDFADFHRRALGWWLVSGSLLLALSLGPYAALAFFCAVSLRAFSELLSIQAIRFSRATVLLVGCLIAVPYLLLATQQPEGVVSASAVASLLLIPVGLLVLEPTEGFARKAGVLLMAWLLAGYCLSRVPALMLQGMPTNPAGGGVGLVIYMVFLAQFNDFAQYVWGKLFGRTKIVPQLSPKKTWAGFLGGLLSTAGLACLLAPVLTPVPRGVAPLLGVIVAAAGFLGDITVSAIKRDAGVKDAGKLLPGFGGVMDRVDSLLYVAPGFALLLRWMCP
ncbi:MAG TPA: phosphatidate cytidylyltransferase [Stenomitos sp.]